MVYSDTSITIFMIKGGAGQLDDTIVIRKDYSLDDYEVKYTEYNDNVPTTHIVAGLYRDRVINYLYMIFKNQALDDEPYKHVQFTLPAMPRMIVSGEKFKDLYYREHFLELIGTSIDLLENVSLKAKVPSARRSTWTYDTPASSRSTAPGVRPQHLYFDDGTE